MAALHLLAALAAIGGVWGGAGIIALGMYGFVATLQPDAQAKGLRSSSIAFELSLVTEPSEEAAERESEDGAALIMTD